MGINKIARRNKHEGNHALVKNDGYEKYIFTFLEDYFAYVQTRKC